YPRDVAATKVERVISYARQHQHPLQCVMEENGT
ncbi:MAG: ATP-dependent Clp protease adaptor ClpS, partial [Betaproteobacteria bacterium]|nr:ATP-dependent Clp protease adaptor ClpS [Betaproteobacteria bacterium]MDE2355067.1 ATP-dependent Clp protease adaptor ClpS [Betaproteobacteria bacterium]